MNEVSTTLTWIALGVLAYTLVLITLRVLAARLSFSIARHNLIVESKHRRADFYREQAAAQQVEKGDGDTAEPDDTPPLSLSPADPEPIDDRLMRKAA